MRISVEGNDSAGKSAALAALRALLPGVTVWPPPGAAPGPGDDGVARLAAAHPASQYALAHALRKLLDLHAAPPDCVCKRSPLSLRAVFARVMATDGQLDAAQFDLFAEYAAALGWEPEAVVYVDTPAALCAARRGDDDDVRLRHVEFQYEALLRGLPPGTPVERVDGAQAPDAVARAVAAAVTRLRGTPPTPEA